MKQQIDNLIANTLLDEGEVYIPGKGSLILRRHAAKRISSKKLQPPYRELTFSLEERGINLVTLISKVTNVSEERASDIFAEWLSKSSRVQSPTRRTLIIGGVCTIVTYEVESRSTNNNYRGEQSSITIDQAFENMANPKGRTVKSVAPRPKYFTYIVISLIVGIALGICGSYLYIGGTFDELLKKQSIIPTSEEFLNSTPKEVDTPVEAVTETTKENPADGTTKAVTEPIAEPTAEAATEPTTEHTAEPIAEPESTPAEKVVEATAEQTEPIAEASTEPTEPKVEKEAKKITVANMQRGYSYAVWGVYRELKNAEKAIEWLAENFPEVETKLYRYGVSQILSVYEHPSRAKCNSQVEAWKKEYRSFRSVWVHTQPK